jgi:hypothetical protein
MSLVRHKLSQLEADLRQVAHSLAVPKPHPQVTQMQRINVRLELFFSIASAENPLLHPPSASDETLCQELTPRLS